ncbi:methyltransferase family protein [Murinocardiopsis flavida]|uniref:Methyltransferase family protein n=1 Tax=Murinocardiopsis flavida TaxID=645275 RepID=A0A2P8DL67_9ACTN|nr:class I SAM-dependent methyltransferase [Murinocardiopsis flavida]PSK97964.1 methyltransferase family protein [Murinocardiopsis flavida]
MDDNGQRHALRTVFDATAEKYERTRPVFPPRLFDDLVKCSGLTAGDRVVEIGCGTGQATVPLAERGLDITAVDPGAELAAIARRRLAKFAAARVLTTSFEDWNPRDAPFDAVVAVNSLHWIDPLRRYAKPSELLREGGAMIVGSCRWARPVDADRFWTDVQEDYRAVGYTGEPPLPPEQIGPWHFPAEAGPFFEETACLRHPFTVRYSAEDYLAILATQSGTYALGAARSAEFLSRVRDRLESLGSPELTVSFVGQVTVGRRRTRP